VQSEKDTKYFDDSFTKETVADTPATGDSTLAIASDVFAEFTFQQNESKLLG